MKKLRNIFCAALALLLAMSCAACSKSADNETTSDAESDTQVTVISADGTTAKTVISLLLPLRAAVMKAKKFFSNDVSKKSSLKGKNSTFSKMPFMTALCRHSKLSNRKPVRAGKIVFRAFF